MIRFRLIVLLALNIIFFTFSCGTVTDSLPPLDYNQASSWYYTGQMVSNEKTDVFYIVSTEAIESKDDDGNMLYRTNLPDSVLALMNTAIAYLQQNFFLPDDFNFFAPYYHQYTMEAVDFVATPQFEYEYAKVVEEVCAAFDYYMDEFNGGRRFIIAGFSQGAMLTTELLKHMTDKQYERLVCAYSIGFGLNKEDLQHPHIKAATGETDTQSVISFNSVLAKKGIWPFVQNQAVTCINPTNWKTDTTVGRFHYTENIPAINQELDASVFVDHEENVLVVTFDNQGNDLYHNFFLSEQYSGFRLWNLHHWDLLFYIDNIRENAIKRAYPSRANL